ncbi:hypothetical protein Tco_0450933 [Tanacetum coccineum]
MWDGFCTGVRAVFGGRFFLRHWSSGCGKMRGWRVEFSYPVAGSGVNLEQSPKARAPWAGTRPEGLRETVVGCLRIY